MSKIVFEDRKSIEFVEEGHGLAPKFSKEGVLPVVVTEDSSDLVLMIGYMNEEALTKTIQPQEPISGAEGGKYIGTNGAAVGWPPNFKEFLWKLFVTLGPLTPLSLQ